MKKVMNQNEKNEAKEMFLPTDTASVSLPTEEALMDYFEFRKANDITGGSLKPGESEKDGKVYCGECNAIGVADMPLLNNETRTKCGFTEEDMSDEDIHAAAIDNQIMLVVPVDDKLRVYPVRYTAYPDILAQAGISGWLMNHTFATKQRGVLAPDVKANWITTGLHLNFGMSHVLIRDGKVEHFKSDRYQVLPEWEGYDAVKKFLKKEYPNYKYVGGDVSHEYLSCLIDTEDKDSCLSLAATFKRFGVDVKEVKFCLRYQTSEVGNASMKLIPIFDIDGVAVPLGDSVDVRHDSGNTIQMFSDKFVKIAEMTKEAEDKVEELGNTPIKNVDGCFARIAEKLGLPQKLIQEEVTQLQLGGGDTAIDVYLGLVSVVENIMNSTKNVSTYVKNIEAVSKTLSFDFKAYDKPLKDND